MGNEYGIPKNLVNSKKIHQKELNEGQSFLQSNSHSAMQQTPLLLWKPEVHYHLLDSQLLDTT
jgi:hypothetical protein